MRTSTNVVWHESDVTKNKRQEKNRHKSVMLWFTGLSGSGKSTISAALDTALYNEDIKSYRLDGDNVRHGLNSDLGFSPNDRMENIRRISEVGKLMIDAGLITLTAFISPYNADREHARRTVAPDEFIEVYTRCSLKECELRDPKGLYVKARDGEIPEFTGISAPYETPVDPEIVIDTEQHTVDESVELILNYLREHHYIE